MNEAHADEAHADDEAHAEETHSEPPRDDDEYREEGTHMDAHTSISDDDHGHGGEALGPIDWGAWAHALLGAASAVVVVVLFWVAIN